ncbi:YdcF family protein [Patescibacteria group bacterium]|nr:YdcF family protein [Patescibacteria group bacterium]
MSVYTAETAQLAQVLWDYHRLAQPLRKAECMIVLGNDDLRTAEYAAELFLKGYAEFVVATGQAGRHSSHFLPCSEAEKFAEVMIEKGVDRDKILLENQALNTGENITFTKQLLEQRLKVPASFLVVTKPYMERRALATFEKVWPDQELTICSIPLTFQQYLNEEHTFERVVTAMVGYVHRMHDYPALGFQISQEIPEEVWTACQQLEALGFAGNGQRSARPFSVESP